jgi:hypothetical protein
MKRCTNCKTRHSEPTKFCTICKEKARKRYKPKDPIKYEAIKLRKRTYYHLNKHKIKRKPYRSELGYTEDRRYSRLVRLLFEVNQ